MSKVKLKDITTKIGSGATPTGGKSAYVDSGISLIRSLNVYDFDFELNNLAHITEPQAKKLSNVEVFSDDILLNITGASVGRCCIVPESVLPARVNQHVSIIRIDSQHANPYYILYYINCPHNKLKLLNIAQGGATREALTKETIENFVIELPSIENQKTVAYLLGVYDNLIENNNRRIAILEEMAQRLYREWFVHFRFPGHENVEMVDSEIGMIPEGWIVSCIGKVVDNFDAKRKPISTMKRKSMQGIYPYYGAAKIIDYVNDYIFDGTYLLIAEDGSVITTESKPVLQYVNGKIWVNNHTHILKGNLISTEQLYLALSRVDISGYITGAAQPKITQENLNRIPILLAPKRISAMFDAIVSRIFDLRICLERKTENQRKTRDHLLPHLISGDIDVSNIEL